MESYNTYFDINCVKKFEEDDMNLEFFEKPADPNSDSFNEMKLNGLLNSQSSEISAIKIEPATEEVSSSTWYSDVYEYTQDPEDYTKLQSASTFKSSPEPISSEFQSIFGQGTSHLRAVKYTNYDENSEIAFDFIRKAENQSANTVSSTIWYKDLQRSHIHEPKIENDLILPKTFDYLPEQLYPGLQPIYQQAMPIGTVKPSTLKRKREQVNEQNTKRLELEVGVDEINAMQSKIPVYQTIPESDICTGFCQIMLPYAPYKFEPKLVLVYVHKDKFAYRFITAEDRNTNTRCLTFQSSANPKPPLYWCLVCGISFARSTTARRHSKNTHQNLKPLYKKSYFIRLD